MNDSIRDLLGLIEEHPDLPVIPMVGQGIVADCTDEWIANFGKAEIRKICMCEEAIIFYDGKLLKMAETLDFYRDYLGVSGETSKLTKNMVDSLDWLEAIIVHVETPTLKIPDNTEKINELYGEG